MLSLCHLINPGPYIDLLFYVPTDSKGKAKILIVYPTACAHLCLLNCAGPCAEDLSELLCLTKNPPAASGQQHRLEQMDFKRIIKPKYLAQINESNEPLVHLLAVSSH